MQASKTKIRRRILVPLGLALLVMLAVSVSALYLLQRLHLNKRARVRADQTGQMLKGLMAEEAKYLKMGIARLMADPAVRDAWAARDREALLKRTLPFLEQQRTQYWVTHMYFIDPDRVCFLRVHKPERHGDKIRRFTLDRAAQGGKPAFGIELGPLGTFALRQVCPWEVDGKVAGYVEFGIEIDHLLAELKGILGAEMFIAIKKNYLNREGWQEGMKMLGWETDWDQFGDFALIYGTMPAMPKPLALHLQKVGIDHAADASRMLSGGRRYVASATPLVDAGGRNVGDIVCLVDVTDEESLARMLTRSVFIAFGLNSLLLMCIFHFYVGGIERQLVASEQGLLVENERRRKAQQALQKARDELEIRVDERTAELRQANESLQQEMADRQRAEDALRESEKLLATARMAGRIAHEINNPLAAIRTAFFLIKDAIPDSHPRASRLRMIDREIDRIANITRQMISLYQPEQEDPKEVRLGQLASDVVALVRPAAEQRQVTIENRTNSGTVALPERSLRQILFNLLQNAVEASPERGEVVVNVVMDAGALTLAVSDQGPGIPEDLRTRVFEMFFTTKEGPEARTLGLGLTSTKGIVESMGGTLDFVSEVGKGTTFRACLPTDGHL